MYWNDVFCPIVLYENLRLAGCDSPVFLSFNIKTMAKMIQRPQHVANARADFPNILRFPSNIGIGFY